jgi:hypothetical protein
MFSGRASLADLWLPPTLVCARLATRIQKGELFCSLKSSPYFKVKRQSLRATKIDSIDIYYLYILQITAVGTVILVYSKTIFYEFSEIKTKWFFRAMSSQNNFASEPAA